MLTARKMFIKVISVWEIEILKYFSVSDDLYFVFEANMKTEGVEKLKHFCKLLRNFSFKCI